MNSVAASAQRVNRPSARARLHAVVYRFQCALLLAVFALPLSSIPGIRDSFLLPGGFKVFVPDVLVLLAVASWPLAKAAAPSESLRLPRTPVIGIPLLLFALCLVPGIVRGHERFGASFVGQPVRVVVYAGIALAMVSLTAREAYMGLVAVLYAGTFWQACVGIASLATGRHQTDAYVLSTGGTRVLALSAGLFAGGALLLALINHQLDDRPRRRWLHLAVVPAAAFTIAVSYGRTTILALLLVVPPVYLYLRRLRPTGTSYRWALIAVLGAISVAAPWIGPTFVHRLTANPLNDTSVRWRIDAAEASLAGMRSGEWRRVENNPAKEQLPNGDFESGTDGWFVEHGSMSTIPSSNPYFGDHSLTFSTQGRGPAEGLVSEPVGISGSRTWTFSVWLKGAVGGEKLDVAMLTYNPHQTEPSRRLALPVVLTKTMNQYVMSSTITDPGANYMRVVVITRDAAQKVTVQADAASLKGVASPSGARAGGPVDAIGGTGWVQEVLGTKDVPSYPPFIEKGRNQLENPNFEKGTADWEMRGGTFGTIPSGNASFGASSLEIHTAGLVSGEGVYSAPVPARLGETWVFSIWLKGFTNQEHVSVAISQYDKGDRITNATRAPFILSTTPAHYFVAARISDPETSRIRALVRTSVGGPIALDADSAALMLGSPSGLAQATPPHPSPPRARRSGLRSGEPLIGLGFGRSLLYSPKDSVHGDPHDGFVWLLAGGGALALWSFLVLMGMFVRDAWKRLRTSRGVRRALVLWAFAMWALFMVNVLTGTVLTDPPQLLALWVVMLLPALAGEALSERSLEADVDDSERRRELIREWTR